MKTNISEKPVAREEFHDVPTSVEHGEFIAYFDVVVWIENRSGDASKEKFLEAAEREVRSCCTKGDLVAFGYKRDEAWLTPLHPPEVWESLSLSILTGQPDKDYLQHGGRRYGEARWIEVDDADVPIDLAWTGVCFRKSDVLQHWPRLKKSKGGRPPTYDWVAVKARLQNYVSVHGSVEARAELVKLCTDIAFELHPDGDVPSDKTVRAAIEHHNLDAVVADPEN